MEPVVPFLDGPSRFVDAQSFERDRAMQIPSRPPSRTPTPRACSPKPVERPTRSRLESLLNPVNVPSNALPSPPTSFTPMEIDTQPSPTLEQEYLPENVVETEMDMEESSGADIADIVSSPQHGTPVPASNDSRAGSHNESDMDDSEEAEAGVDGVQDPSIPTQKPSMGNAERELKSQSLKSKKLNIACMKALKKRAEQEEDISNKTGTGLPRVKKMMGTIARMRNKKKPSVWNAAVREKALEVNNGRAVDNKVKLKDLYQMVREDPELMRKMKDRKESAKMVEEVMAAREDKMRGAWDSNKSRAKDASDTLKRLTREANDLSERCPGAITFGIVCRGSFDSSIEAGFYGRGPVNDFLKTHFNINIWDFVALMEAYSCKREKLGTKTLTADATKKALSSAIQNDLESITGHKVSMSYTQYERQIQHGYHVTIEGWPEHIPKKSPFQLHSAQARELHDLWQSNVCHWRKLTKKEQLDLKRKIEEEDKQGEKPARAVRKDKGGTHSKPSTSQGQAKGKAKQRMSRAFDDDDEDNYDDDDGEEDDDDEAPTLRTKKASSSQKAPIDDGISLDGEGLSGDDEEDELDDD
ncbi:hypothetical protein V5O48_017327 [Marasmius crinis-equi]|uniref:Uncharacterized protein n=1 Tax=Marasmius crinis-equi TaxID=585013 RepID=A0ABR3EPI1_9AGAR